MKLLTCLAFLVVLHTTWCMPQNAGAEENYDLDYYEPRIKRSVSSEGCLCIPFYQCINGEIVEDGSNIMDARGEGGKEKSPLNTKNINAEVQKEAEKKIQAAFRGFRTSLFSNDPYPVYHCSGIKVKNSEDSNLEPKCPPYHVCCRMPEVYEHKCGNRNPGGINGSILTPNATGDTEFGEFPWQAAILKVSDGRFIFNCGGTLIDEKHILTAAHCVTGLVDEMDKIVVRLGEWDTQNTDEFLPHEDYNVQEILIHPQYRSSNHFNDIAILKLTDDVEFRPHIDTACLPRDDDDFTGQECIVSGWGKNSYKEGVYSMIMKKVSVPVLGHNECQNMLRKTRLGRYFKLHGKFMCAGGKEGEDTCKGDGGGPLVCLRSDNSYTVAGLVSWGIDCGHPDIPGVYVNVKKFNYWITRKTGKTLENYWRP